MRKMTKEERELLTDENTKAMRIYFEIYYGLDYNSISAKYGVDANTIEDIRNCSDKYSIFSALGCRPITDGTTRYNNTSNRTGRRLAEEKIIGIYKDHANGIKTKDISDKYKVSKVTIHNIVHGKGKIYQKALAKNNLTPIA